MKLSTQDRAQGKIHEAKGAIRQTVGKLANDPKLEADGQAEKTAGKIQNLVGKVEKASQTGNAHRERESNYDADNIRASERTNRRHYPPGLPRGIFRCRGNRGWRRSGAARGKARRLRGHRTLRRRETTRATESDRGRCRNIRRRHSGRRGDQLDAEAEEVFRLWMQYRQRRVSKAFACN